MHQPREHQRQPCASAEGLRRAGPAGPARGVTRFEAPRGTHDILPSEQPLWRQVTRTMEDVCRVYGYRPITTPGFEDTELIVRTSGDGSDIVQKETYTFADRGGRSLTLRPEGTAPICRAYIEHGLHREPQPQKLYTIGPMWRYDRPQKGRYREHWQLSVEAIGSDDPAIDAEIIQLYDELLRRLGVTDYELELNSIGDANCRPGVPRAAQRVAGRARLRARRRGAREARDVAAARVRREERTRVQALLADAPKIGESLCDECKAHFARVRELLDAYGVRYESCRRSCAASTTTRARRSSSRTRRSARRTRSAAAAATTG